MIIYLTIQSNSIIHFIYKIIKKITIMEVKLLTKEQSEIKTISFETLKRLSDCNVERLNRNIDVDTLLKVSPNISSQNVVLESIMVHYHHKGKLTDPHFRCYVKIENLGFVGMQDVFDYQWEGLN